MIALPQIIPRYINSKCDYLVFGSPATHFFNSRHVIVCEANKKEKQKESDDNGRIRTCAVSH